MPTMTDAPPSMQTWVALHRAHARTLLELSRRMERERQVSVLEHGCLYELLAAPDRRLRMTDLAQRLGMSPSAATRLVDRLVERGWVDRASPPDNRRTIHVCITTAGRRVYARNNGHFTDAVEDAVGQRLRAEEMEHLATLLAKLSGDDQVDATDSRTTGHQPVSDAKAAHHLG